MTPSLFWQLFPKKKPIIATVHVFDGERQRQINQALEDTERLQRGGVDGLLIENYDCGYLDANWATEEMAERLAEITIAVRKRSNIPVGLNVLPNDYWKSFFVALSASGVFIQMDHITGNFDGCESVDPEDYFWTRQCYPNIAVFGGIHPKYYQLVDPTCSLADCAKKAMDLADAVVVTGQFTGDSATLDDLLVARKALGEHPLVVGSGLTPKNTQAQLATADGAIVGTAFKKGGVQPGEPIDVDLVKRLMDEVMKLR
jgi:membrane complex biogenesis BtpA family protein